MSITHEKWLLCKTDYLTGNGSLREVAARHGIAKSSVEKKARNEEWTRLRCEFEKCQLEKLLPPALPSPPLAPVAPDGVVSDSWLAQRVEIHYRKNIELIDKTRTLLDAKLTASEKPSADELGKMTTALSGIISAEIALLGLNRRRDKRRRPAYFEQPLPSPTPQELLQPIPTHETSN
jgi:hypothetical protein